MIIVFGSKTSAEIPTLQPWDFSAKDYNYSYTYVEHQTFNDRIKINADWKFVQKTGDEYLNYRIQNNGYYVLYSPSRKAILMFVTSKKGIVKQAVGDNYLFDKSREYIFDVINEIDEIFFAKSVEYFKNYNYVNIIKYVMPEKTQNKYAINKGVSTYNICGYSKNYVPDEAEPTYKVNNANVIYNKQKLKRECKERIGKKFVVGKNYYLRSKTFDGSKTNIKEFIVKQIIYKIDNKEVNSLVVKQISGINNAIFTLTIPDCKKLHIKYEPGLQVFPMQMNWIPKNENYE